MIKNSLVAGYCSVYSLTSLILLIDIAYIYGMKWAQLYRVSKKNAIEIQQAVVHHKRG